MSIFLCEAPTRNKEYTEVGTPADEKMTSESLELSLSAVS